MKPTRVLLALGALLQGPASAALVGALGAASLLAPASAQAQELSADLTERCVRATVKVLAVDDEGRGSSGSGSIIDARGYVLTNYHVVARIAPGQGGPLGSFFRADGRVVLALADSARQAARPRYLGEVVRADPVLDLAIVRIVADSEGRPVTGQTFPFVPMATTQHLRPGARVFAFGYPLDLRTINVTAGSVTGFQMNGRDEVSWLRTDARFNHGNSGGMLVDAQGHLVAIPTAVRSGEGRATNQRLLEPIELARPVERVPAEWLSSLRSGNLTAAGGTGFPQLRPGQAQSFTVVGDSTVSDADREQRFFGVPQARPALVRVNPTLPIAVMDSEGHVLREGQGQVAVSEGDPPTAMISVLVPRASSRAVAVTLNAEASEGALVANNNALQPPPGGNGAVLIPVGPAVGLGAPQPGGAVPGGAQQAQVVVVDRAAPIAGGPPQPIYGGSTQGTGQAYGAPPGIVPPVRPVPQGAPNGVVVRASVVDGTSGSPVQGAMVLIGRPGTDVMNLVGQLLAGRITEQQFDAQMMASTRTDAAGRYQFPALPRGQRYTEFVLARGFRPVQMSLPIDGSSPALLDLSAITLQR